MAALRPRPRCQYPGVHPVWIRRPVNDARNPLYAKYFSFRAKRGTPPRVPHRSERLTLDWQGVTMVPFMNPIVPAGIWWELIKGRTPPAGSTLFWGGSMDVTAVFIDGRTWIRFSSTTMGHRRRNVCPGFLRPGAL